MSDPNWNQPNQGGPPPGQPPPGWGQTPGGPPPAGPPPGAPPPGWGQGQGPAGPPPGGPPPAGPPPGAPPPGWNQGPAGPPPQQPGWGGGPPQGAPPGQPGYGQGPPQQQWGGQPAGGGLQPNVAALLAYLFGWIGGLIVYFTQKHPEARFHAAQSILVSAALTVLAILFGIIAGFFLDPFTIGGGGGLFTIFSLLGTIVWIGQVVLLIILCIQGYQLKHFKLPIVGDIAERWASKPA